MRAVVVTACSAVLAACGIGVAGEYAPGDGPPPGAGDAGGDDALTAGEVAPDDAGSSDGGSDAGPRDSAAGDGQPSPARKKSITIDGAKVGGVLADFPVWIDLVDAQVAARAQADGRDLFFTASDGAPLAYQIQRWDRTATRLDAWVRVPRLSSAGPTVIYLRYGDPVGAPAPSPKGVFSASFAAVWHLEDALTATAIADATSAYAGTAVGLTPTQQVGSKLGGGIAFRGGGDEITFVNPLTGTGPHTISLWVSQQPTSDNDALVVLGNGTCGQSRWFHSRFDQPTIAVGFYCNDWSNPAVGIEGTGWTLLHWVFEGTNDLSRLYRDGALAAGPFTHTGSAIATQGAGGHLGNAPSAWGPNMGAHATLDEVRIATVARAPEWIATEYANQSSPSTFYAVGPEQPAP